MPANGASGARRRQGSFLHAPVREHPDDLVVSAFLGSFPCSSTSSIGACSGYHQITTGKVRPRLAPYRLVLVDQAFLMHVSTAPCATGPTPLARPPRPWPELPRPYG